MACYRRDVEVKDDPDVYVVVAQSRRANRPNSGLVCHPHDVPEGARYRLAASRKLKRRMWVAGEAGMDIAAAEWLAEALIRKYLQSHGSWEFRFDGARRKFGSCRFIRKMVINGRMVSYPISGGIITLSRVLTELNNVELVKDAILHEIAHALCGPRAGHSKTWKKTARMIGCNGKRCYDTRTVKLPASKYIAECPNCGRKMEYDRKRDISCGRCDNKFNPEYRMVFRENPNALQPASNKSSLAEMNITDGLTYGNTEGGKT